MAARFNITSRQLAATKIRRSPFVDLRSAQSVAQIVDTFYFSADASLVIDATTDAASGGTINLFNQPDVRRKTFGGAGLWEFVRYPVLRPDPDQDGALRWLFGWLGGSPQLDRPEFIALHRTQLDAFAPPASLSPAPPSPPRLVSETLHILGPGGRPVSQSYRDTFGQAFDDHEVLASAVYTEPVEATSQNRIVLYSVERATGFWSSATTVAVHYFDDPASPTHQLRQVTLIRGIEG